MAASEDFRKSGLLSTVTSRSISACGEFSIWESKKKFFSHKVVCIKNKNNDRCRMFVWLRGFFLEPSYYQERIWRLKCYVLDARQRMSRSGHASKVSFFCLIFWIGWS